MNRNYLWKLGIVVLVLVWSFVKMYPPLGRDPGEVFREEAHTGLDTAFTNILQRYDELQNQPTNTQHGFPNLAAAVGTNDITRYFPQFAAATNEADPSLAVLNLIEKAARGKIRLGLDLQGGTEFRVGLDTNYLTTATDTNNTSTLATEFAAQRALDQAVNVLRARVDRLGVAEPLIQPAGNNTILIQLPGLSADIIARARANIQKAAYLELRMVHTESRTLIERGFTSEPGYDLLTLRNKNEQTGAVSVSQYLVSKKAELTGQHITKVRIDRDPAGQLEIDFELDSEGAKIFGDVTRQNVGHQLAIVLDGKLQSAPNITEAIPEGRVRISGDYTDQQAQDLAAVLQNPLQVPVKILSERSVDPTLGSDTIKSGVNSAIIGTVLVAGFMAVYYLFAGVVADLALVTNIVILLGVMCYAGTTFTLPGIAGVVLTVGMAVDANVLIFERIREESGKGKSLRGALAAGYDRAFGTIFDSHVTTLISSVILIYMGTGPIKGFGVTLTIGVAASLFTALVVTRLIFDFLIGRGLLKSLPMFHLIRPTKLDFMKYAKPAFIFTWTLIVIGLAYGVFFRGSKMMGIDFKGGDNISLAFKQKVSVETVRADLEKAGFKDTRVQYQKAVAGGNELLSVTSEVGTGQGVQAKLLTDFASAGFEFKGSETIGPSIGKDILQDAVIACALSLLGILLYVSVRYEFLFAAGAVVAVIHDVLMTIGCYCLTGLFSAEGRQFNATMVAAILTIIGFSINDTIVIFDRIREDLKLGVRGSFSELINVALNQTLSRTIITSGTVFLATMSLFLFGGGAINDFAFTFLVGIITGTYSSIYIASALVLWWHHGVRPRTSTQVAMESAVTARP